MKTIALTDLHVKDGQTGHVNAIIETPSGSRNKMKYMPKDDLFALHKVLPLGSVFPRDFGFIPSTLAEDGDPLDVLVFMDAPAYPGNLVPIRLIGVIKANQSDGEREERNDRILAVAAICRDYGNVQDIGDLDESIVTEIEHFFISYNALEGKRFAVLGRGGQKQAQKMLDQAHERYNSGGQAL